MKKMLRLKFGFACALLSIVITTNSAFAQNDYLHCGTTEMFLKALKDNPELLKNYEKEEARYDNIDKQAAANGYKEDAKALATVYVVPVVFHILHTGGTENISDAQVRDAIRILNEDYRKLNSDISNVVPSFQSIAADCEIEFRLAKKDPNGNCTNGIDRIYSTLTNSGDDNSKLNIWDRSKYLNIWTVKTMADAGVAGYSYYPSTAGPSVDGVIILSGYIGSIGTGSVGTSRALTHEIGHYLNLKHTWGSTNSPGVACGVSDNVSDTPETKGHTSCTLTDATCNPPTIENVQNYMEYAYCSNMFTAGQRTRMRTALTTTTGASSTAQRYNLWTTTNLTATGVSTPAVLCQADFETNNVYGNVLCQGDSVTFNDLAWNGDPTSWSWTFPGGTPSTSTDSTPTITYNTPGLYNASLIVTNASGTVSANKTGYIRVNQSTATITNTFYSEGFETAAVPNNDWQVINYAPAGNTWTQTASTAATGSKCVMITNNTNQNTYIDDLISPPIDMTAIAGTNLAMTFKLAYAQRDVANVDKLVVYISTNCGKNWIIRKAITGATMASAPVQTTNFIPNSTQWLTETVNLSGYATQPNLYVKFTFTSNGGNNIYIDDINLSGTTSGIDELANNLNFNVFPNPAEDNTTINFNLIEKQKVNVIVTDVVGRQVATVFNGELNSGEHTYSLNQNAKLSAGVYFVTLTAGGQHFSKKLIVK